MLRLQSLKDRARRQLMDFTILLHFLT